MFMSWPNAGSSAVRTCWIDTGCSNCSMTTVPPANSTPLLSPLVAMVTTPATMMSAESAMACQRQRRKS